jgi:signal peptidase II
VFELYYHENRGSIWGILQGKVDVLLIFSILLFALMIYVYVRMPKTKFYKPLFWVLVVMIAGAIGNTIDRLFFGFVTDFLYFKLINFPIFNVADCYITVCAFLTIILVFTVYKDDEFTFLSLKRKETTHAADAESDEN